MNDVKTYKCGHPIKEVIINTSEITLFLYNEWKKSKSDLCIECWLEIMIKRHGWGIFWNYEPKKRNMVREHCPNCNFNVFDMKCPKGRLVTKCRRCGYESPFYWTDKDD